MNKSNLHRESVINEYWELEDKLKMAASKLNINLKKITKDFQSLSEETILFYRPMFKRQVELLRIMRSWELEKYDNVVLLPVSSLRKSV